MPIFFAKRLFQALIAIFGVMTLIFFLQRLAGDPVLLLVPMDASQADVDRMRIALGFDRPVAIQYLEYISNLMFFDLGRSYVQNIPVAELIWTRVPYTLMLAAGALVVAFGIGIPVGITLAIRRGRPIARLLSALVLAGQSMPTFWSAILMIMVFGVWLGWAPPSGARELSSIVMPSIALGLLSMATFARVARTAVLDELEKDYVRTGHAKGLPMRRIIFRHLLRNASIPVVTVSALEIANLLAGAVIVETVFAWPGLGQLTIQAITARDFMVVQGVVMLGAITAIGLNLVADLLYSLIDPRIRMGAGS
ncbi:ABC transporter permease subunit [Aliirhizobium cellulosilyticum]|uniref:Peptide/nickel transport system permease protein n=1 Tax=Aliirhizobium cellulosilyticum TaxID=393664 RepID=A0A7W6WR99_9HYPH|nr:peptide/nickel transport system permease protein [Rhizobium cellulosilyticum]MBB4413160.1 peptide/nickel transport system permease protein [Rhizobium cellulosilyticum]MBB4447902.1 peptide/nickel transport system permease protein [Rhizobium cellulosilyticum]